MPRADLLRSTAIVQSPRVQQLLGMFDIPPSERSELSWQVDLPLDERKWNIGLIVGPSGSGKSTILAEMFPAPRVLNWPEDAAVIDGFPKEMRLAGAGDPDFASAAIEAINQWRFTATRVDGVPIETPFEVNVSFIVR